MTRWKHVKWTEAGQVTGLMGWPQGAQDRTAPEVFFDALKTDGRRGEAVQFIAQALPRFEAIRWAVDTVRDCARPDLPAGDANALKAVLLWLQDPSDGRRRAAFDAASRATDDSPERVCALAVFFSGGSMAPDNLAPVLPPKEVLGSLAGAAVISAASKSGRLVEVLDQALVRGDALASGSPPPRS